MAMPMSMRQPFGRITISNSDAGAYAHTDGAIDQATGQSPNSYITPDWRHIPDLISTPETEPGASSATAIYTTLQL
jgi:hypothetical protein